MACRPLLLRVVLAFASVLSGCTEAGAGAEPPARIAVAGNFAETAKALAERFRAQGGGAIAISSGSTGALYAQIVNGAPFDAFLAADAERPRLLEERGLAVPGSRFVYARGRLALYAGAAGRTPDAGTLRTAQFRQLAIADPRLAPYGIAAEEVLARLGIRDRVQDRLLVGENVAQAFHFVHGGGAELGLVALAQVRAVDPTRWWPVPEELHGPILQEAVRLGPHAQARAFLAFVHEDPAARALIEAAGYAVPDGAR